MIVSLTICLLSVVSSSFSYDISFQHGQRTTCETNSDCSRIKYSHCSKGICECLSGYTIDGSLTRCLKVANGYYDTCEESVQCSRFLGAGGTCDNNKQCVCTDSYHYLHGQCHETKGLYERCSSNDECFVNADYQAASCLTGICRCSERFYQREYSTCRPLAEKIGDKCLLDSDCGFNKHATCVSSECTLNTEITHEFRRSVDKKDESPPNNDQIIIGVSKCNIDADCKLLEHSICAVNSTCVCDRGYFPTTRNPNKPNFENGCVPEIGTACDPDVTSDFNISYATCKNNEWTCDIDKVAIKDNRLCREVVLDIGKSCQYPENCQVFGPRADCVSDKCICNATTHWVKEEKFCWKTSKLGEFCEIDDDCYSRIVDYSPKCRLNVCTCPKDSVASHDGGYCYSKKPQLGFDCEKDEECQTIPNASCKNKKCACAGTFFEREKKCIAGLNSICENDDDCKLENTQCYTIDKNEKVCHCTQNFTVSPDNICNQKSQYQKACKYDVQCSAAVKNTFCNMTTIEEEENEKENDDDNEEKDAMGRCDCTVDYYFNKDACYRKLGLGQKCNKQGECFTTSSTSVCRNGICSCEYDFVQVGTECKLNRVSASPGLFLNLLLVIMPVATILTAIP